MKRIFLANIIACFSFVWNVNAQQVGININMEPAVITVGQVGLIRVTIYNSDANLRTLQPYKIRPLVSLPSTIVQVDETPLEPLPDGWMFCSNDGTNIRVSNGSSTLEAFEQVEYFIRVKGIAAGGPLTVGATLAFAGG